MERLGVRSRRPSRGQVTDLLPTLSNRDFQRFSELILREAGIRISAKKKAMLESRLRRRLRQLGIATFDEYSDHVFSGQGVAREVAALLDEVTTNQTQFFREPAQFEYLAQRVLPAFSGTRHGKALSVWSAGCATGEEAYTLAMVLAEYRRREATFHFRVLGTDISHRAIEIARRGVYAAKRVEPIPLLLRKRYLMRSRDRDRDLYRVVPELRARASFRRLNFMATEYGLNELPNIIFCRNVIIYLERAIQEKILARLCRLLVPDGYLFVGPSETLLGFDLPLIQEAPTVYRKPR